MSTATAEQPPRTVEVRVLDDDLFRADEKGELRHTTLCTINAQTKAGEVAGLYELLDCGTYFRVRKLGAKVEVYTVTVRDGVAIACTCPAGVYLADKGPDKHCLAVSTILATKE